MTGACKRTFSLPEIMSMFDLDDTQSGSDLDIDNLNDEPDVSDSDNEDVAMDEPSKASMNEQRVTPSDTKLLQIDNIYTIH